MNIPIPTRPPTRVPIPTRPIEPKKLEIHFQENLMGEDFKETEATSAYTSKIVAPIYEPKNRRPDVFELVDRSKTNALIERINASNATLQEKIFLISAANRHSVFNYRKIADYYAHASEEMQLLMEDSALVIIDFEDAIAKGYVRYSEEIAKIYAQEHGKTE